MIILYINHQLLILKVKLIKRLSFYYNKIKISKIYFIFTLFVYYKPNILAIPLTIVLLILGGDDGGGDGGGGAL